MSGPHRRGEHLKHALTCVSFGAVRNESWLFELLSLQSILLELMPENPAELWAAAILKRELKLCQVLISHLSHRNMIAWIFSIAALDGQGGARGSSESAPGSLAATVSCTGSRLSFQIWLET